MAVDTRATTTVTIDGVAYTLLSASLTDESIQNNGLVRCRGNATIKGTLTPQVGAVVRFSYTTATGTSRVIPRTLRVLSSFANPQTRQTQIELGDLLVYLDNRKPGIDKARSREENGTIPCSVYNNVTIALSASYIFNFCLAKLGITASSNPLTNRFTQEEYDLSAGYVSVINELLLSESYAGYLDYSEVLQVRDLSDTISSGPLLSSGDILALNAIGTGALPGESAVVNYTTKRLVQSIGVSLVSGFDSEQTIGDLITVTEPVGDTSATVSYLYQEGSLTTTRYDAWNRAVYRRQVVNGYPMQRWTETWWRYRQASTVQGDGTEDASECIYAIPTTASEVAREYTEVSDSLSEIIKACNFDPSIYPTTASMPANRVVVEKTVVTYAQNGGVTRTATSRYVPFVYTPAGAEIIRKQAALVTVPASGLWSVDFVTRNAQVLTPFRGDTRIRSERQFGLQQRPSIDQRTASTISQLNGAETVTQLEWIFGTSTSAAVTTFSLPRAPDDYFTWTLGDGYVYHASDAQQKALKFGRVQNAMLLGNRQGMGIQCSPLKLPPNPFDPIYITAGGFTAQYRVNGLQWNINATDVIASTDAMLWGVVGATGGTDLGTSWIPLPPSVATLPAPPASASSATYGTVLTPTVVIPPYDATLRCQGGIRLYTAKPEFIGPIYGFIDAGYYVLTGNAIEANVDIFAASIAATIDISTYAITGNEIGAVVTGSASATIDLGVYLLTGNAISVTAGYSATITSYAFTLTGNAIAASFGYIDTITTGAYVLTGNNIAISGTGVA